MLTFGGCFLALSIAMFAGKTLADTVSPTDAYGYAATDVLETVDISGNGKLQKLIIQRGAGDLPKAGDQIYAHYTGKLTNGHQFDSSRTRDRTFDFPLGKGRVIKGWDQAFATMQKGEKAVLVIAPEFGYGSRSMGSIPASSTLYFDVELVDFGAFNKGEL